MEEELIIVIVHRIGISRLQKLVYGCLSPKRVVARCSFSIRVGGLIHGSGVFYIWRAVLRCTWSIVYAYTYL